LNSVDFEPRALSVMSYVLVGVAAVQIIALVILKLVRYPKLSPCYIAISYG